MKPALSIVIPARNEAAALSWFLPELKAAYPDAEIILVNDGSTDNTSELCQQQGITEVRHPYGKGNGAAIKSGARAARADTLILMDGDGQHQITDIARLLERLDQGFDLVVGARVDSQSQANLGRLMANGFYNRIASWMVNHTVADLTSGFRAVKRDKFCEFLSLYPNGFSYPTTSTMAFFRAGYSVDYLPIKVLKREGKSHIRLIRDGVRFLLIIFKIGTLFSPLKLFAPVSLIFFLTGLFYYAYTFITQGRFTNMSALLFSTSLIIFMIGLVSEQVTSLQYQRSNRSDS